MSWWIRCRHDEGVIREDGGGASLDGIRVVPLITNHGEREMPLLDEVALSHLGMIGACTACQEV